MAEDRKAYMIKDDNLGEVRIADEVVAIIAGLAATEVEGVSSMRGNITNELVSKLGMKNLSKGIKVKIQDNIVSVDVALNIGFDLLRHLFPLMEICTEQQLKNLLSDFSSAHILPLICASLSLRWRCAH